MTTKAKIAAQHWAAKHYGRLPAIHASDYSIGFSDGHTFAVKECARIAAQHSAGDGIAREILALADSPITDDVKPSFPETAKAVQELKKANSPNGDET